MAVAPLPQVEEVLQYGVTEIAPGKIQLGIPNYGYDWTLPYEPSRRAATIGNQEAVRLAGQVGAEIQFDTVSQAPISDIHGRELPIRSGSRMPGAFRQSSNWRCNMGLAVWLIGICCGLFPKLGAAEPENPDSQSA